NLTAQEPLLDGAAQSVVHTGDRLAIRVGHALDVFAEVGIVHDEQHTVAIAARHLTEQLGPGLVLTKLLGRNIDNLLRREVRVIHDTERLSGARARNDGLLDGLDHRFADVVSDILLKDRQRHNRGDKPNGYTDLQLVVAEDDLARDLL